LTRKIGLLSCEIRADFATNFTISTDGAAAVRRNAGTSTLPVVSVLMNFPLAGAE